MVYNGVDAMPASTEAVVAETLAPHWASSDAPYVLWVGSLEPRKNLRTLVSAFARLAGGEGPTAPRLALVGPVGWLGGRPWSTPGTSDDSETGCASARPDP